MISVQICGHETNAGEKEIVVLIGLQYFKDKVADILEIKLETRLFQKGRKPSPLKIIFCY